MSPAAVLFGALRVNNAANCSKEADDMANNIGSNQTASVIYFKLSVLILRNFMLVLFCSFQHCENYIQQLNVKVCSAPDKKV